MTAPGRFSRPPGHRDAELAVLDGGPFHGRWYWRPQLEVQVEAARDAPRRSVHACVGAKAVYQPTEEFRDHPEKAAEQGRIWRWAGP